MTNTLQHSVSHYHKRYQGNLSLVNVSARESGYPPSYEILGGTLFLRGRITGLYTDAVIANLSIMLDTNQIPSSNNRNFICVGNDNTGTLSFFNVYLNNAGKLMVGGCSGFIGSNAFLDLSTISFPCLDYPFI